MDDQRGQPGSAPVGTLPRTALPGAVTGWIRLGVLDPELAGLVSIMIEHGLPLVVAAGSESTGNETAGSDGTGGRRAAKEMRDGLGRILLASTLPPAEGTRTPAPVSVGATSLELVLARMPLLSLEAVDESGARVAIVVVLGLDAGAAWRVVAAHLLRPPLRDGHGHLQRQGPAVLATWDPELGRFEHFAWAVMPELARLIDRRAGDLEVEVETRVELLAGLVAHRIEDPVAVRLAIEAARTTMTTPRRH